MFSTIVLLVVTLVAAGCGKDESGVRKPSELDRTKWVLPASNGGWGVLVKFGAHGDLIRTDFVVDGSIARAETRAGHYKTVRDGVIALDVQHSTCAATSDLQDREPLAVDGLNVSVLKHEGPVKLWMTMERDDEATGVPIFLNGCFDADGAFTEH